MKNSNDLLDTNFSKIKQNLTIEQKKDILN